MILLWSLILFVPSCIVAIVGAIRSNHNYRWDWVRKTGVCMVVIVGIVGLWWNVILGINGVNVGLEEFPEAQAFVDYTQDNYVTVINNNNELAVKGLPNNPTWIPVDKMNQSLATSERIKDFLDRVNKYNENLYKWKAAEKSWYWQPYFPAVPEGLKPIRIEW